MQLKIERNALHVIPNDSMGDQRDVAFIEDTLGLKRDGDAIVLVRENAMGLSCMGRLSTMQLNEYLDFCARGRRVPDVIKNPQ